MDDESPKDKEHIQPTKKPSMVGSTSYGFLQGHRSEYLAHYVFSSFGTSVPVPGPQDTGIDLYCTLAERIGQRIWPRAYFSVQVKSTPDPWKFEGPESVRWLVDNPLPLFLCIVEKHNLRLRLYHTFPRFYVQALPPLSSVQGKRPGCQENLQGERTTRPVLDPGQQIDLTRNTAVAANVAAQATCRGCAGNEAWGHVIAAVVCVLRGLVAAAARVESREGFHSA
jgi:hypothetical protein